MSFLNNKYKKLYRLGEGSFGRVFLVEELNENKELKDEIKIKKLFAIKKLYTSVNSNILNLNLKYKLEE